MGFRQETGAWAMSVPNVITCLKTGARAASSPQGWRASRAPASRLAVLTGRRPGKASSMTDIKVLSKRVFQKRVQKACRVMAVQQENRSQIKR